MTENLSPPELYVTDEQNPHLGGYRIGGDEATFYPELWTWLVREYGVRSVIDVGCGEGHALRFFERLGCRVHGIDGIASKGVYQWDFTEAAPPPTGPYDLIWCCEFVEHVEERYIPNFLATFQCADLVLLTHAFPGQPGYHHVNLREPEYWKGVLAAIGYGYDEQLTAVTRELAAENTSPWNHYLRAGLAFTRNVRL